jgi:hypothetical protein
MKVPIPIRIMLGKPSIILAKKGDLSNEETPH